MANTLVQIRIDENLKKSAVKIFDQLGLDLPTAFRIFLKRSVEEGGIPFEMKIGRKASLEDGRKAFYALRDEAEKNGVMGMKDEDINEEIYQYRAGN